MVTASWNVFWQSDEWDVLFEVVDIGYEDSDSLCCAPAVTQRDIPPDFVAGFYELDPDVTLIAVEFKNPVGKWCIRSDAVVVLMAYIEPAFQ
jgi:hypothetical protein